MKTKKELNELSSNIGKAIRAYHKAIFDNLKESGKEHKVLGDNDEGDKEGLRLTIIGRHDDAVEIVVDKVRYKKYESGAEMIEVHICEEEFRDIDYWVDINILGDDADYVNDNIIWED